MIHAPKLEYDTRRHAVTQLFHKKYAILRTMIDLKQIRNSERREAVRLLDAYLRNPGRFSILLLGKPGTGKTHWVKQIQTQMQKEKLDGGNNVTEQSLRTVTPTKEAWTALLRKADEGILVLKGVEDIKPHDTLLFEALGTTDGTFGFTQNERFSVRIVFTSSYDISSLRMTEEYISHRLFDRIAQLVVKFPSLSETPRSIWDDFRATWDKIGFQEHPNLPGEPLRRWLEGDQAETLHGNFRDLDKIAILWHQFRLMGITEKEILGRVKNQLLKFSAYPEQHTELGDVFYFKKGKTAKELLDEWRSQLKKWAIKTYESPRDAEEKLGVGRRTMDRW